MFATQEGDTVPEANTEATANQKSPDNDETIKAHTGAAAYAEVQDEVCFAGNAPNDLPVDNVVEIVSEELVQAGDKDNDEEQLQQETETPATTDSSPQGRIEPEQDAATEKGFDEVPDGDGQQFLDDQEHEGEEDGDIMENETSSPDPILSGDVFGPNVPVSSFMPRVLSSISL